MQELFRIFSLGVVGVEHCDYDNVDDGGVDCPVCAAESSSDSTSKLIRLYFLNKILGTIIIVS